jgi:membrane-bound lytic murein transglycosylase A
MIAATAVALLGFDAPAPAKDQKRPVVKIGNSQLEPVEWSKLDGWAEDDHAAAFATFMTSCTAILRSTPGSRPERPVFRGLHQACEAAVEAKPKDAKEAREFFEKNFRPVRITPLGETAGFLTGYYEPIVDGSLEPTEEFVHPLYRTPPGLLKGGKRLKAASFGRGKKSGKTETKPAKPSKPEQGAKATINEKTDAMASGKPAKKKSRRGGRKLVSFYDRAAIEDGVLKGRNLEICYLKDPIDSFFIHIQGSARVRLKDGRMMRVNYASQNGHAYYPVGRWLIDQKIYTREEVTMDRIREWMTANPKEGEELRRRNKSYVFFRETGLSENEEPVGAQGVSLTSGRSLAVDRNLHVYGTPFFIQAELPIESEQPTTKFRRLMIAQDTGGAIIGPARADIYYGAGEEAGLISGRFKQPGQFVMLFPNGVDPFIKLREIPLPRPRPANIPQDETPKPDLVAAKPAEAKPAGKLEGTKQEAAKPEAKKQAAKTPEAKPEAKEAKKPEAKSKTATAKPADSKPASEAKPNGKKKTQSKKPAEAAKPRRTIDPAPPS